MDDNIFNKFLNFESTYNLFSLEFESVNFWHLIRFDIYILLAHPDPTVMHPDCSNISFLDKAKIFRCLLKKALYKETYSLLISVHYVRKIINGKLIDPFSQFLIDHYPRTYLRYTCYSKDWIANKEKKEVNNSRISLKIAILKRIRYLFKKKSNILKTNAEFLSAKIHEVFGVIISVDFLYKKIDNAVFIFKQLLTFYKKLLSRCEGAIFLSDHYNLNQFALIAAAKMSGLPTIEHQHGVIGRYHIAYNFVDRTDIGKYFPDYLFVFGDYWKRTCKTPSSCKIIPVGSPQMDDSRQYFKASRHDEKSVVFYSSGEIGEFFSKLAIQFADLAKEEGYKVVYKFHPSERLTWKERYPWLAKAKNIQCEDRPINVHELLASAKHHVGVASTVLFEALAFRGNVYVYSCDMCVYLEDVVACGAASYFKDVEELLQKIKSTDRHIDDHLINDFFCHNSTKTIVNTIERIIDKEDI